MKGFKPVSFLALSFFLCVLTACNTHAPANGPAALFVANKSVPGGVVQSPYSVTLGTIGGMGPFTWTLSGGTLPPGIGLSSAGVLSGTPPITDLDSSGNAKSYSFTVKVTDSQTPIAAYNTANLSITINPLPLVTTTSLPNGTIGLPYVGNLTNSGGLAPFTWSLTAGTLPAGLSVNGPAISGTPTGTAACGTFPITVQVTDADSNTASANLQIVVTQKLGGNNAFSFNGFDNGQPFYAAGSFVGDCTGNITSGFIDENGLAAQDVITKAPVTGTFSIWHQWSGLSDSDLLREHLQLRDSSVIERGHKIHSGRCQPSDLIRFRRHQDAEPRFSHGRVVNCPVIMLWGSLGSILPTIALPARVPSRQTIAET